LTKANSYYTIILKNFIAGGLHMNMEWIWMNGQLVKKEAATVSILAHGLYYGSSFFEGIRAYMKQHATKRLFFV